MCLPTQSLPSRALSLANEVYFMGCYDLTRTKTVDVSALSMHRALALSDRTSPLQEPKEHAHRASQMKQAKNSSAKDSAQMVYFGRDVPIKTRPTWHKVAAHHLENHVGGKHRC